MNEQELKAMFQEELNSFKAGLNFLTKEGLDVTLGDFKKEMEKQFGETLPKQEFTDTMAAFSKEMTDRVEKYRQNGAGGEGASDFRRKLHEAIKNFDIKNPSAKEYFATTNKAVYSTNFSNDTMAMRIPGVGEIKRGVPYVRDFLTVVPVGSDNHDTISWYEQLAITNNAANAAEVRNAAGMSQSNMTWTQKNLNSRRIHDFIKVGVDRMKDVAFVEGEVRRLIERNMKLKENDQLLNGIGTGNEIAGLLSYATDFVTTGISIEKANLIDLVGKIKTQIDADMLGAAMPNGSFVNRIDVDEIRYKKATDGQYLFPNLALGNDNLAIAGINMVENPLVTENTLLVADFSLATLYVWDDLVIEMYFEGTDKRDGLVTIGAYMRENLRVQDVDTKAFVKVTDIAQAITDITTQVA